MKNFIFLYLVFTFSLNAKGQQTNTTKLNVNLEIIGNSFSHLIPLYYSVTLTNQSDENKEIFLPWSRIIQPQLEIKVRDKDYWFPLKNSDRNKLSCGIARYKTRFYTPRLSVLKDNQTISKNFSWASFTSYKELADYIGTNTIVELRTSFKKNEEEYEYSNSIKLPVEKNKGVNKKAVKWLSCLETPDFFYDFFLCNMVGWSTHGMNAQEIKTKSEAFLEKFPKSKFAPWVKLNLAYWYQSGFPDENRRHVPDEKKALKLLEELSEISDPLFQEQRNILLRKLEPKDNLDWLFDNN